jgi:hypothetical protein
MTQIGNRILSSVPLSELLPAWIAICEPVKELRDPSRSAILSIPTLCQHPMELIDINYLETIFIHFMILLCEAAEYD